MEIAIEIVVAVIIIIALFSLDTRTARNNNKILDIEEKMMDDRPDFLIDSAIDNLVQRIEITTDKLSTKIDNNSKSIQSIKDEIYKQDYPNIASLNTIKSIRLELGGVDYVKSVREVLANMSDDEINELMKKL